MTVKTTSEAIIQTVNKTTPRTEISQSTTLPNTDLSVTTTKTTLKEAVLLLHTGLMNRKKVAMVIGMNGE